MILRFSKQPKHENSGMLVVIHSSTSSISNIHAETGMCTLCIAKGLLAHPFSSLVLFSQSKDYY